MKAIIPSGGRGTRMYPVTFSANKHFIPLANKPLIFYPIETIADVEIKDIAITYNPGWLDPLKNLLGDGKKWGVKFTYILQEEPKGLANIFQVCENYLAGESFVFHLGDNIFADGIGPYVDYFLKNKPNALMTIIKVAKGQNTRMGVPYFNKKKKFKEYVEKPKSPPNDFGIPGLYFFDSNVFKCFKGKDSIKASGRGEFEISSPYNWLVKHGYKVDVKEYEGKWLDPGKFDDWLEANRYLLSKEIKDSGLPHRDERKNLTIEERVEIGKNCKIRNCKIRGPVRIGNNVEIDGAFIGPYSSIYNNCKLNNCRLSDTILMENVNISDVDSLIDSSLIGSNTTITDNKKTGDQVEFFLSANSKVVL